MTLMSEVAALHGQRFVLTIKHEAFVDCGCPHATGDKIVTHRLVVKADATAAQVRMMLKAWAKYDPHALPVPVL